jgi:arginine exporter protein ArgO
LHHPDVTISEYLSIGLLIVAAIRCYGKAPLSAFVLSIAWFANLAYVFHGFKPDIDPNEALRLISTITGLVGAIEFGRGVERTMRRIPVSIPDAMRKVDARTWIGLLLLASMGVDGFGMIVWKRLEIWIVPEATIGILCLVILAGTFGKENDA